MSTVNLPKTTTDNPNLNYDNRSVRLQPTTIKILLLILTACAKFSGTAKSLRSLLFPTITASKSDSPY